TPHRDHLVRDDDFAKCRDIIEDAMIEFMENTGEKLVEKLTEQVSSVVEINEKIAKIKSITGKSAFFQLLTIASNGSEGLLADVPALLKTVIDVEECPQTLVDYANAFVKPRVPTEQTMSKHELARVLDLLQQSADDLAKKARKAIDREEIQWSPHAS